MLRPRLTTHLFSFGTLLIVGVLPGEVLAQNQYIESAEVETCNIEGQVSVTVLGVTTHYPITCVNPSERTSAGTDSSSLVGTQTVNVPVTNTIASVTTPVGESIYSNQPDTLVLASQTSLEDLAFVQHAVEVEGLAAQLQCYLEESSTVVKCFYYMGVGSVYVAGQNVSLPPNPIPLNYQIPVSGLSASLSIGGIPLLVTNLAGTVTLNQIDTSLSTTHFQAKHIPIAVHLTGSVSSLGLGLVQVTVDVRDPESAEIDLKAYEEAYRLSSKSLEGADRLIELALECIPDEACPTTP